MSTPVLLSSKAVFVNCGVPFVFSSSSSRMARFSMVKVGMHRQVCAASLVMLLLSAPRVPVYAQLAPPVLTVRSTGARPVTASEAAFHVLYQRSRLESAVSFRDRHYPIDSMLTAVSGVAMTWLGRFQQRPVTGLQFEPAAGVGVRAKQDPYAKGEFATALTTRGRSVGDRSYTLFAAVAAYADWRHPDGLPTAEQYVTALAALGPAAASRQYRARELLMRQYYLLGRSADVIRHGNAAVALLPTIPYAEQGSCLPSTSGVYTMLVDALTGQSGSRAKIDALNTALLGTVEPPAALVVTDTGSYRNERNRRKWTIAKAMARTARLGTVGQPWIANYWVNRATTDSATISVTDGKIRLVEHFIYTCDGCVHELHVLQRLQQQFPSIEAMGVTNTIGYWGNRLVDAEDEAHRLTDFFVNRVKLTIPVGIWKATKVVGEDGGFAPELGNWPTVAAYPKEGKACVWLIDGQGHIRGIYGGVSRDDEQELARQIAFLEQEAATRRKSAAATAGRVGQ
jgi:hypothetical protein